MAKKKSSNLKITLLRSPHGRKINQRRTLDALGLRRVNQTVERPDHDSIRGMIEAVKHLVQVEEA